MRIEPPTTEQLQRSAFLAGLPPALLSMVLAQGRAVVLARGQRLWSEGARADEVVLVISGLVKSTRTRGGGEVVVDLAFAGDVVGDVEFALDTAHVTTASCLRRTRALVIPSDRLREAFRENPRALASALFSLARRAQRLQRLVGALRLVSVPSRLAAALVELVERTGADFPGGTLVPVRLARADLAALAATTPESVSRTLAGWAQRGLLTLQPEGYLLHDVDALRVLARGGGRAAPERSGRPRGATAPAAVRSGPRPRARGHGGRHIG